MPHKTAGRQPKAGPPDHRRARADTRERTTRRTNDSRDPGPRLSGQQQGREAPLGDDGELTRRAS